jgi:branched-subunit amino acid transport protein AzlD
MQETTLQNKINVYSHTVITENQTNDATLCLSATKLIQACLIIKLFITWLLFRKSFLNLPMLHDIVSMFVLSIILSYCFCLKHWSLQSHTLFSICVRLKTVFTHHNIGRYVMLQVIVPSWDLHTKKSLTAISWSFTGSRSMCNSIVKWSIWYNNKQQYHKCEERKVVLCHTISAKSVKTPNMRKGLINHFWFNS